MAAIKYHNGSGWVTILDGQQKIKYYNGSSWVVPQRVKYYSGGWQTAWVNDVSGPTGGSVYAAAWSDSVRGFNVSYNAASDPSGIAVAKLQYSPYYPWSWTDVADISTSGGTAPHTVSTSHRQSYSTAWYRTRYEDSLGNPSSTLPQAYTTKPFGSFAADPISTSLNVGWGTWATGFNTPWRTGISHVYSGWIGSSSSYQYGYVFYGDNTIGGASGSSRGYAPDSATVSVSKSSSSGCGGVLTFATHNYGTRPTTPNLSTPNGFSSGSITLGGHETVAFSSGARSAVATNSGFGLLIYPNSSLQSTSCAGGSTYRQTASPGDYTYDTDPWRIYIHYTV